MSRKPKKYHIIYKTTNKFNGKFYVGMHSTDDLDDGYLGSGRRLKYSIHKYGKEAHIREILEYCPDKETLKTREAEIITEQFIKHKMCLNLKVGGEGGWDHLNDGSKEHRSRSKRGRIASNKSSSMKKLTSERMKKSHANGRDNSIWLKSRTFSGKTHSEETKQKISKSCKGLAAGNKNSQYGKVWIYSLIEKKSIKIPLGYLERYLLKGWIKGRRIKF